MGSQFVQEVSDETFQQAVVDASHNRPVVVDFWAEWCGPCIAMAEPYAELAEQVGENAVFTKLNVDENPLTGQTYGVMSIPTLIVFVNGEPAMGGKDDRIVGLIPTAKKLQKRLADFDERITS